MTSKRARRRRGVKNFERPQVEVGVARDTRAASTGVEAALTRGSWSTASRSSDAAAGASRSTPAGRSELGGAVPAGAGQRVVVRVEAGCGQTNGRLERRSRISRQLRVARSGRGCRSPTRRWRRSATAGGAVAFARSRTRSPRAIADSSVVVGVARAWRRRSAWWRLRHALLGLQEQRLVGVVSGRL